MQSDKYVVYSNNEYPFTMKRFYAHYTGNYSSIYTLGNVNYEEILKLLNEGDWERLKFSEAIRKKKGEIVNSMQYDVYHLNGIMLCFGGFDRVRIPETVEALNSNEPTKTTKKSSTLEIHFPANREEDVVKLRDELKHLIIDEGEVDNRDMCFVMYMGSHGIDIRSVEIKRMDVDIDKHYNDDFKEVHEKVVDHIENSSKGLMLFHGKPGTGKTTYIKYLLRLFPKKRFIIVPADMIRELAQPSLLGLLMNYPDSVLIVEDSEKALEKRSSSHASPVHNILAISDGILSDILNIQIMATFNTKVDKIDEALLRDGRLIVEHEFDELTVEKAQALNPEIHRAATIAEVMNWNKKAMRNKQEDNKIGFSK